MADKKLQFVIEAKDKASAELEKVSKSLGTLDENTQKTSKSGIGMGLGLAAVGAAAFAFGKNILGAAADAEMTQTSFEVMLGSAEEAQKFVKEMKDYAAATPYETADIAKASQTFLSFGMDVESSQEAVRMIGDIAMGNKTKFDSLSLAFAQVQSTGKLMGQDLLQMINQGFNPLQIISEKTGISMAELKDRMSDGSISAAAVSQAFKIATSEGGRFYQGSEKGSQTLAGVWSTLKDSGTQLSLAFGEIIAPAAKKATLAITDNINKAVEWVNQNKESIITAAQYTGAILGAVTAVLMVSKALSLAKGAMGALQGAIGLITSPIGAIVIGVALLAAGLVYLSNKFGGLGNAMTVIGKSVQALGLVLVIGFKTMGNALINFLNSMLEKGNKAYNYVSGLLEKVGVDIGKADFKIDFQFDVEKSKNQLTEIGTLINNMEANAAAAKVAAEKDKQTEIAKTAEELAKQKAEAEKAAYELKKLLEGGASGSGKQSAAAKEAAKETEKLSDALVDLAAEYEDVKKTSELALIELGEDHREKMKSIQDDIDKTTKSIKELKDEYASGLAGDKKSLAEEFVSAQESIADLKKEIAEEDDASKKSDLQEQLAKEEEAYIASAEIRKQLSAEIAEAERVSKLTDLEKAIEDYNTKRALADSEYQAKMTDLKNELTAKRTAMAQEVELFKAKQLKTQQMLDDANIAYATMMDAQYAKTSEIVTKEIELYKKLAQAIKDAQSASSMSTLGTVSSSLSGKRASGGPVNKSGAYLVGENGPELFVPSNNGEIIPATNGSNSKTITTNQGQSITINITGNEFLGEEGIADRIFGQLMRQIKDVVALG